jgi:hypothetical protein
MISTDLFPYENYPYRLEFGEGKNSTICWFECEEHLQKHLTRYKIDTKVAKIDYRDEKPIKPSKKHKRSVEPKSKPKGDGSVSANKRRKSSVDSTRNTTRTPKSKK